ncbi:MAG: TetR family transcriptional regulator [Anaerolineae bacterium]|nr:TetR family transcriptional regulator [Anaerolineae bacterium]
MRRTKEEADITRQRLLLAALNVFSSQGYDATRLEDIAAEAEVTRGAIYHHFGGKAELYNEMVMEFTQRVMPIITEAVAQGGSVLDTLRRLFVSTLSYIEEDAIYRAVNELVLFKTSVSPELAEGMQRKIEGIYGLIEFVSQQIQQGMDAGEIRGDMDARDTAIAFLSLQNGLMMVWLLEPKLFSLKAKAQSMAEIFIHGIVP